MVQTSLLAISTVRSEFRLNTAMDAVNERFGRNTLVPAAMGLTRSWSTKFDRKSPGLTV
ncbi:DUF4113 domain-containing protein [Mesorhizobium sp. M0955]|uniref:DUF4113 domain-containing protein n=1 Tax=Mesorhizobium sp. M0955 TaxID=2957033 RepID=UPI0033363D80